MEERDGGGTLEKTYTYANYIDEPITLTTAAGTFYYHTNNLYNVRALTDDTGAVVERYRYSAYGSVTILDANGQEITESAVGNVYMFQGRRLDPETGLYYYRNRMMSAELGRFLQRDPLGYVDGWNLYEYVGGNPLMHLDPMGLESRPLRGSELQNIRIARNIAWEYGRGDEIRLATKFSVMANQGRVFVTQEAFSSTGSLFMRRRAKIYIMDLKVNPDIRIGKPDSMDRIYDPKDPSDWAHLVDLAGTMIHEGYHARQLDRAYLIPGGGTATHLRWSVFEDTAELPAYSTQLTFLIRMRNNVPFKNEEDKIEALSMLDYRIEQVESSYRKFLFHDTIADSILDWYECK